MSHMKALLDSLDSRIDIHKRDAIKSLSNSSGSIAESIFYLNLTGITFDEVILNNLERALAELDCAIVSARIVRDLLAQRRS